MPIEDAKFIAVIDVLLGISNFGFVGVSLYIFTSSSFSTLRNVTLKFLLSLVIICLGYTVKPFFKGTNFFLAYRIRSPLTLFLPT